MTSNNTQNSVFNDSLKRKKNNSQESVLDSANSFDFLPTINQLFLSIYLQKNDPFVGPDKFDYAFIFGNHKIYLMLHEEHFKVEDPKIPTKNFNQFIQTVASNLLRRFDLVHKNNDISSAISQVPSNDSTKSDQNNGSVYFIGLSQIKVSYQDKIINVKHDYGSKFFQQECVLDLDNEDQILQLFSVASFVDLIKLLQTPSDALSYFNFHRNALINQNDFDDEITLAKNFLEHPSFYQRALNVQKKLVEIGLLAKVETRLVELTSNSEDYDDEQLVERRRELVKKLQDYSTMFQKLVNGVTKRYNEANKTIPIEQIRSIIDESMYTRMSIMEEVVDYEFRSEDELNQGYLRHLHSYNKFGRHYLMIVYGLDNDAEYSRENVKNNHTFILMDLNCQLQDPVMKEYFIFGFDMSNHDGRGNVKVEMDVFHQYGSAMSTTEKRLYERLQSINEQ